MVPEKCPTAVVGEITFINVLTGQSSQLPLRWGAKAPSLTVTGTWNIMYRVGWSSVAFRGNA